MQLLTLFSAFSSPSVPAAILFASPVGKLNMTATDILVCPKQTNAIDILCCGELSSDRHETIKVCPSIQTPLFERCHWRRYSHGRFVCDEQAKVPGGEWAIEYV